MKEKNKFWTIIIFLNIIVFSFLFFILVSLPPELLGRMRFLNLAPIFLPLIITIILFKKLEHMIIRKVRINKKKGDNFTMYEEEVKVRDYDYF